MDGTQVVNSCSWAATNAEQALSDAEQAGAVQEVLDALAEASAAADRALEVAEAEYGPAQEG